MVSSPGRMKSPEKRPWVTEFFAAMDLPSGVRGPVEACAFWMLAAICAADVDIEFGPFLVRSSEDAVGILWAQIRTRIFGYYVCWLYVIENRSTISEILLSLGFWAGSDFATLQALIYYR